MSNKSQKLKNLEKKFNTAQSLVEELGEFEDNESDHFSDVPEKTDSPKGTFIIRDEAQVPEVVDNFEMMEYEDSDDEEMFSLKMLKQDFMMARQNVMQVCNIGQNILRQASVLDLSDLKASQLDALTNLQNSLGNNLKLMITLYKEIIDIEKSKAALKGKKFSGDGGTTIVQGDVNQNVIMAGGTHDLLDALEKQRQKREKELNNVD